MISLRNYQHEIINSLRNLMIQGHSKMICQLATGGGKTIIFSFMVKQAAERGKRCLVLTDRVELLEQSGGTFEKLGIAYENITAKTKAIPNASVLVAMVETIKRRAKARLDFQILLSHIDLLIIDEAHKCSFDDIFQYLPESGYVIGATATPTRASSLKPLSKFYTNMVLGPSIELLIKQGFLAHPKYYGVEVDLSSVKMDKGEFSESDMTKVYGDVKVFEGLKHNLELHAKGKKTMIFCPSVQSSMNVAQELNCAHVDGTMAPELRDRILTTFENTPGAVLSNCGITTTGYDCPSIECIVLYRATTSLPLYLQMVGRGSRTTPDKHSFTILDFGMNVQRFGYWHEERPWSLESPDKKKKKKKDVFPVKFCPQCGAILAVNVKTCEYCGYVWPVTEQERVFAELKELSYAQVQEAAKKAETLEELEALRVAKDYKTGWLLHRFETFDQFKEYERLRGYRKGWAEIQAKNFGIQKSA